MKLTLSTVEQSPFYSRSITGFVKTGNGVVISPEEKARHGLQSLVIECSPRGYATKLVDTDTTLGAQNYSGVLLEVAIGNNSGRTQTKLTEHLIGSGFWRYSTVAVDTVSELYTAISDPSVGGSTIVLSPGTYVLPAPLRVDAKRIRLMGSPEGRVELIAAGREGGIIEYSNGGGGDLVDLNLVGGSYGIGSDPDARRESLPSSISIRHSTISDSYRGLYGAFSALSLDDVVVSNTARTGISLTHVQNFIDLGDIEVHNTGGWGLLVYNTGPGDVWIGGHYHHNAAGGVAVVGHDGDVTFLLTVVDHNNIGIGLWDAHAVMGLSAIQDNDLGIGLFDKSVLTVGSTELRDDSSAFWLLENSTMTIQSSQLRINSTTGSELLIIVQADFSPDAPQKVFGAENVVCGFNLFTANEALVDCGSWVKGDLGLEPPGPPPL